MKTNAFISRLALAGALFLLWLLLSGSLAAEEVSIGIVVAVVAAMATPRIEIFNGFKFTFYTPLALLFYLLNFLFALVKANLDLAKRVLTPALPLNPEIISIKTELQSELGRLLLANSITLTPGTLTVDVKDDRLLVHWIDSSPASNNEQATQIIAADFEKHIKGFLK